MNGLGAIPYEFVSQRVKLDWTELKFGMDHEFIKPKAAIEKATDEICRTDVLPQELIELACLTESEPVADLVTYLAKAEIPHADDQVKGKWLYLVLAWLFEQRDSLVDPLGLVETVYSEFGYPKEITPFVRYMPMDGPDLGNREQNEARMFDRWKAYITQASKRFGRTGT